MVQFQKVNALHVTMARRSGSVNVIAPNFENPFFFDSTSGNSQDSPSLLIASAASRVG